jgi:hypothetical protein
MQPLVTQQTLAQIIVALSNFMEEGKSLSPALYITTDISKLLQFLPGSSSIKIGEVPISETAPSIAIKHCAPLAIDGWCIYVCCSETTVNYGLFRDALNPLAIPLEKALLVSGSGSVKILHIHQSAVGCVEVANHKGDKHVIFLSQKRETEPSPREFVEDLVKSICSGVQEKYRESTQTVIGRVLTSGLENSHGALVAVTNNKKLPKFLMDGRFLESPINFSHLVSKALNGKESDRLRLLSYSTILSGMFGCDGIIVFNRQATITGFNCFIKSNSGTTVVSGGARKRAFEALKGRIDKGLFSAYIRSQDGWSEFKKSNK